MKKFLIAFVIGISLLGCNLEKNNQKTIVLDDHTYVLVRPAKTNSNGIVDAELWERVGVTNRYYTPSLDGKSMQPLMK